MQTPTNSAVIGGTTSGQRCDEEPDAAAGKTGRFDAYRFETGTPAEVLGQNIDRRRGILPQETLPSAVGCNGRQRVRIANDLRLVYLDGPILAKWVPA
jgi:hypothetical protein